MAMALDRTLDIVSIHASVKDATISIRLRKYKFGVSIHASVKDATALLASTSSNRTVSIHASVKDATSISFTFTTNNTSFNPRICKRCDLINTIYYGY